jgi:hypothetical protein
MRTTLILFFGAAGAWGFAALSFIFSFLVAAEGHVAYAWACGCCAMLWSCTAFRLALATREGARGVNSRG